jgi:hypothetical protein
VGGKQSMNHPTDIYSVAIKSGKEQQLTDVNKEIYDQLEIGKLERRMGANHGWQKTIGMGNLSTEF